MFYPWESPLCEDLNKEACKKYKPYCTINPGLAYRSCRKTCEMCIQDHPKPFRLKANLTGIASGAFMILTQTSPDAPTFMTVCANLEKPQSTYSAVIHSFGDVRSVPDIKIWPLITSLTYP